MLLLRLDRENLSEMLSSAMVVSQFVRPAPGQAGTRGSPHGIAPTIARYRGTYHLTRLQGHALYLQLKGAPAARQRPGRWPGRK